MVKTRSPAGFEELAHTADWCLHVWAPDLPGLFAESALGMNALSGARTAQGEVERPGGRPRKPHTFTAQARDPEGLLVRFLSELVYAAEQEHLIFTGFKVNIEPTVSPAGFRLQVEMAGATLAALDKAIKAVTYHNLKILQTAQGYEVEIVFDV